MKSREQQLIDILFQVASMTKIEKSIQSMKHEEYMEWVARQLELGGFKTHPCGASWGVLENIPKIEFHTWPNRR